MSCSKAMEYLAQVLVPLFEKLADFFWKGTDGKYFQLRGHAVPTTAAPKTQSATYKPVRITGFQPTTIYKNNDIVYTRIYSGTVHKSQTWMNPWVDKWIQKVWSVHKTEYYSSLKGKEF